MITFEKTRYILEQTNKYEDACLILEEMFFSKGKHVAGIEFLPTGELLVVEKIDAT